MAGRQIGSKNKKSAKPENQGMMQVKLSPAAHMGLRLRCIKSGRTVSEIVEDAIRKVWGDDVREAEKELGLSNGAP